MKITITPWRYQDQHFEVVPDGAVGFTYRLTHIKSGLSYIGKKAFFSRTSKRKPGKTRRSWTVQESNWRKYFSSSDKVKQLVALDGPEAFKREILDICYSKRELTYREVARQFEFDVLYSKRPDGTRLYLNDNILGKFWGNEIDSQRTTK